MFSLVVVAQAIAWLILAILSVTGLLQVSLLVRRHWRARYFRVKDNARARLAMPIRAYLEGEIEREDVFIAWPAHPSAAEMEAISELAGRDPDPEAARRRSQLLWRTGHVAVWAEQAFGKRQAASLVAVAFGTESRPLPAARRQPRWDALWKRRVFSVPRALALYELGRLAPEHADVFLIHALHDPSVVVRRLAIESMGENHSPRCIPSLLEELRRAVEEGNDVSLRTIKSALVRYSIADMESFLPFFTHPTRRMRFFVIDTLREICHRSSHGRLLGESAFSPAMRQVVLEACARDEFPDVRARAAGVIRHFLDAEAVRTLHTLLQDENEFVRLHAVRACAHPFYRPLITDLLLRVTDVRWRVREAAVRTLIELAPQGLARLYDFFATSRDRYACEQTAEELQCRGLIHDLVLELAASGAAAQTALKVCNKLVQLGYTSMLISELGKVTRPELHVSFVEALRLAPGTELSAVLHEVAEPHPDAAHRGAVELLYREPTPTMEAPETA